MSWAQGMFAKPKRRGRSEPGRDGENIAGGARSSNCVSNPRRKKHTLTELRWHQELPTDGSSACACSRAVCLAELTSKPSRLPTLAPEQISEGEKHAELANQAVRSSNGQFQEVATGLRLKYYTVGEDERVILLLHGLSESAGVMAGLATRLASHGYKVITLDLRGHGDSSHSSESQYTAASMASDLESFVTEQDLYVRPLAVVGVGLGGMVGLEFAKQNPMLVGALVLAECSMDLPEDSLCYHYGQAGEFASKHQAVSFLCSRVWGHAPRTPEVVLKYMDQRGAHLEDHGWRFKMDPRFFYKYTKEEVASALQKLTCPLLVVHGERSHMVVRAHAEAVAACAASAASTHVFTVPKSGHYLLEDSPLEFRNAILGFLLKNDDALMVKNKQARRPELLGIRPLPQYATLEEAIKALKPRSLPTQEDIEESLAKARLDDEAESDEDEYLSKRTGLIKEDPEYFGFVG